jgi:uncharacterized coiled-coil protein SlyX
MTPTRADLIDVLKQTIETQAKTIESQRARLEHLEARIADLEHDLAAERSVNGRRQGLRVVGRG